MSAQRLRLRTGECVLINGDRIKRKVYDNIFEALKTIDPSSMLLGLACNPPQLFAPANRYEVMGMGDGTIGAFPSLMFGRFFRGEHDDYPICEASIYRNHADGNGGYDEIGILADELKIIDFKNILLTFPQVKFAIEDQANVDFLALAQHYELNTPLLDITSSSEVAAYFATHKWVNGLPVPIADGIGCIRGLSPSIASMEEQSKGRIYTERFHMIGLQCFRRPGLQAAFGLETEMGEDYSDAGWRVLFRQDMSVSERIHLNFHYDAKTGRVMKHSWLFPEEEIAEVAKLIKRSRTVTRKAVEERCEESGECPEDTIEKLQTNGYKVCEAPIFELTPNRRLELTKEYAGRPYGDVALASRLTCLPNAEVP